MLIVKNLNKTYRDGARQLEVISNLNFSAKADSSIAILGRSGVGKSSLLQILGALDSPSQGEVICNDVCISGLSKYDKACFRRSNIGFVFQFHHLLSDFSSLENVALPLLIAGIPSEVSYSRASEFLDLLGLKDRLKHRPSQLSGGEQQRVAIARALVHRPKLVLADEPTGNLDIETATEVTKVLLNLRKEIGATLVVVTHSRDLASKMDITYEMLPGGNLVETSTV